MGDSIIVFIPVVRYIAMKAMIKFQDGALLEAADKIAKQQDYIAILETELDDLKCKNEVLELI